MTMEFFNYGIPLVALALGAGGLLIVREMSRRVDREMAEIARQKHHHPAE
ncbi:hypothetical protein QCN27_12420 [Cereibacter sp. SYSU M97828]|nr:hypothetical protein [Cereibacter flavus]